MTTKTFLKAEMNYQKPGQRPGCANCKLHENITCSAGTRFERTSLRCILGDFQTVPQAICNIYQPEPR